MSNSFYKIALLAFLAAAELSARTILVSSNADSGPNTLREAMTLAAPGDIITFNSIPQTISLASGLPVISGTSIASITIDGTSQSSIEITSGIPQSFGALQIGSYVILKGLTINNAYTGITAGNNNQILNCFIGTDTRGLLALPNNVGITLNGPSNTISSSVISGNTANGISILATSNSNTITNNKIGVASSGNALANGGVGIACSSANNTISGNIVNSNTEGGIFITGNTNTLVNNIIQNNGTKGILIDSGGSQNSIGLPGLGNTISGNKDAGVVVGINNTVNSTQNTIQYNSIAGNGLLGIDLGNLGTPLSKQPNPSPGPNNLQNAPTLTSASLSISGDLTVGLSLQSAASTPYAIQFFSNKTNRNPVITEGATLIGGTTVNTNASGSGSSTFTFTPLVPILPTDFISATATSNGTVNPGNTSEFSFNIPVQAPTLSVSVATGAPSFTVCAGTAISLTANVTNEADTFTYEWSTGDTTQTITIPPTETTTATVTVTDSKGLQGTASQKVTVNPSTLVALSATTSQICVGGTVTLTAEPQNLSDYTFLANGTIVSGPGSENAFIDSPSTSTTYLVTAVDSNKCTGTSNSVTVTVATKITPGLTANTETPCIGQAVTLIATPNFQTYNFYANDELISSQSNNTLIVMPKGTTTYTVSVTGNGCQGTSDPIIITPAGCANISINKCCSKSIFPQDIISFTINVQNNGPVDATNIVVTDILPDCFTFKKASGKGAGNAWKVTHKQQTITATLPHLAVGQKASFSFTALTQCQPGTVLTNTATVITDNSPATSSTATIKVVKPRR